MPGNVFEPSVKRSVTASGQVEKNWATSTWSSGSWKIWAWVSGL